MLGCARFHTSAHTVKALIEECAQAPARAISAQTVQVVNMHITVSMRIPLLATIHAIKPVVCDELAGEIIHKSRVGIARVGVGVNAPILLVDVFLDTLRGIHISRILVEPRDVLTLHFVQESVVHKRLHHAKIARFMQLKLYGILNSLHAVELLTLYPREHARENLRVIIRIHTAKCLFDCIFDLEGGKSLPATITF